MQHFFFKDVVELLTFLPYFCDVCFLFLTFLASKPDTRTWLCQAPGGRSHRCGPHLSSPTEVYFWLCLMLCFLLSRMQFKMLPELFQDDEKAISPTSATPSGRTPLSRVPSKPTKGRPGQLTKEHKKTVGHQVRGSRCEPCPAGAGGLPSRVSG